LSPTCCRISRNGRNELGGHRRFNHPGDTYFDVPLRGSVGVCRSFGRHKAFDRFHACHVPPAPDIDRPRIGFYGFSRGGYTGLVSFGGNPDWACATEFCQRSSAYCCEKIRRKEFPVQASHTTRGSKLASSPTALSIFFTGDSLASVSVPVQL